MSLSASDLAFMRSTVVASFPDVVTISRLVRTPDAAGGTTTVWSTIATVQGRLMNAGGQEIPIADSITQQDDQGLTLPYGTDVTEKDRVAVQGLTYEVVAVSAKSWQAEMKLTLRRFS